MCVAKDELGALGLFVPARIRFARIACPILVGCGRGREVAPCLGKMLSRDCVGGLSVLRGWFTRLLFLLL